MRARVWIAVIVLLGAGCGNAPEPGLVRNAGFERDADGRIAAWRFGEHAVTGSYRFDVDGRTLVIERVGEEPWGQVMQYFPAADLVGRTLRFSADVRGAFDPEPGRSVMFSGISVRVDGFPAGKPKMLGKYILLSAEGEPAVMPGTEGWQRASVRFEVPAGATDVQVAIRLGMDGQLRARNPALVVVDE